MHGADEVIPRMARGEVANPFLLAGQVVHFETEADDETGMVALRAAHARHVVVELIGAHPPVVEIIAPHGRMIGEADFLQSQGDGVRGVLGRLAHRVAAERRVHVVISRQRHGRSVEAAGKKRKG